MQEINRDVIISSGGSPLSVAVFLSGEGTNFEALVAKQKCYEKSSANSYGRIDVVFTNVPGCGGEKRAKNHGIPVISLSSKSYFNYIDKDPGDEDHRMFYDAAVLSMLAEICDPDLIVLAGFRRRLSKIFFNKYRNRIINMYPGDITKDYPKKGVPAYKQAMDANERTLKCSVYIQDEYKRFGSLIAQSEEIVLDEDEDSLIKSISSQERKILPYVVHELIANGRVSIDLDDNVYIDGKKV